MYFGKELELVYSVVSPLDSDATPTTYDDTETSEITKKNVDTEKNKNYKTIRKIKVLTYMVPESSAPITLIPMQESRFSLQNLFSRKNRKLKRILESGTCGHRIPGIGLRFMDKDLSGNGEICLTGGTLAEAPEMQDEWLHTGDLGHLDEGGYLYVTGKVSDRFVGDKRG